MVDGEGAQEDHRQVKRTVLARLKEARHAVDDGLPVPDRSETVARFLEGWVDHIESTERTSDTVQKYGDIVKYYIKPKVGRVKLTALSPAHVGRSSTKS